MFDMPLERKQQLMKQHKLFSASNNASPPQSPGRSSTYGPSSGSAMHSVRVTPQRTGDNTWLKRFAVSGKSPDHQGSVGRRGSMEDAQPLQPQSTGGLWNYLWTTSGGEQSGKGTKMEMEKSPTWYVDGLRLGRMDNKRVTHLISLRVHLSTAKLPWIQEFVGEEKGLEVLGSLLAELVGRGGKRKMLSEAERNNLLEIIKCLRVLLNTEVDFVHYFPLLSLICIQPGFEEVLSTPIIITHIAYALHVQSVKLRTLAAELLAAICILSLTDGHKAVLSAMSDFAVEYGEQFRFETLISSLRVVEAHDGEVSEDESGLSTEEEGVWEARTACMALVNALTNCPDSLDDRVMLREEFGRRALNEVIVVILSL